ncbi:MAG: DUF3237 domain-containing protein [Solobacterium sp.]|nr:DUF3237 domain-containing protein [Solobacterium sp.]MBQ6357083.1 DUF3237 domain-containing protein [Solobacterium sp.]MBR0214643.1 DUF3237 domain-containing protein [Solobacterium sp.]
MKELFTVSVQVAAPIVVGQDGKNGRRQLIPILAGTVSGVDPDGNEMKGVVLPGGVDSQVIRPDGKCELSARYAVRLSDGASFYIENNGMRTVPAAYREQVLKGEFIDPSLYYFATVPFFEVYSEDLRWMENHVFFCQAVREPDAVHITYFMID